MRHPEKTTLAPEEILRVMDAARVIHEHQSALAKHESLDREATIREIQLIYEELGDVVDQATIEKALDEYLSQRYAFTPARFGLSRSLAHLYVWRGWIASRLFLPAAAEVALAWTGLEVLESREQRIQEAAAARLVSLETDVGLLHAAILETAAEDVALDRAAEFGLRAESQIVAGDEAGLAETLQSYEELHDLLVTEYRIVITGGVWRVPNDNPNARNHYLLVRALGPDDQAVSVSIRNEENDRTEQVAEWGERVPQEVYNRVAADKQDNGIIDDEEFGAKRRGFINAERRYPDIGQITEW